MTDALEKVLELAGEGEAAGLPEWNALPNIPLYMDQVILYLSEALGRFRVDDEGGPLTSSMINNYVKNQVIPRPEKKKYSREHIAALIAVCVLKQILPLQDIRSLIDSDGEASELYALLREAHGSAVSDVKKELEHFKENGASPKAAALRLASEANARRAAAEFLLASIADEDEEKKKK